MKYADHELAGIFPLMSDDELASLADDVDANGLRDPVWLYEGKILDGRNRYRACQLKDVDPRFEQYKGKDPLGFVISKNLHRRHLTESQRAMVAARLANLRTPKSGTVQTVASAAEALSVSPRTVDAARTVESKGAPELVEAVERGDVSVSAAAEVAKLPKAEQKKAVKDGTVAEKAKEQRAKKSQEAAPAEPEPPAEEADPAAEFVGRINRVCVALDALKKSVTEIGAEPTYGRHVHVESVTYQIECARKALWQSRPTEPCNCIRGGKPAEKCKACFGTGLMPASRVLRGAKR